MEVAVGNYTGDGAATQAIAGVGFQPRFLIVYKQAGGAVENKGYKFDVDGAEANVWVSGLLSWYYSVDHIISLDADGFTVGDGTGTVNTYNILGIAYTYIAFS